jgi:predicted nucleic acid-binding Zn ribbon protein
MAANEPVRLGDVLHNVVRSLRPEDSRVQATSVSAIGGVFNRWDEAVGAPVAAHVQPLRLEGTTLVVEVDDPAWATQMRFLEATLRERLAEVAGATVERIEVRVAKRR